MPRRTAGLGIVFLVLAALALGAPDGHGQPRALAQAIVGTWTYVAVDTVRPDGTREPMYGPNPTGVAMFDDHGHYMLLTARRGMQRFASSNRLEGTADENRSVVQGAIAHFGRYTVNEADRTITFRIETSTFPNWNGTEQKRPFVLEGDTLRWRTAGSSGGTAEVVLKRAD